MRSLTGIPLGLALGSVTSTAGYDADAAAQHKGSQRARTRLAIRRQALRLARMDSEDCLEEIGGAAGCGRPVRRPSDLVTIKMPISGGVPRLRGVFREPSRPVSGLTFDPMPQNGW